ncbi:MAG: pyruvate kinase [Candidatus Levybacteria bacterium]|nr:pyruvate kinase [Candidatus Levybacteria bacterium]
MAVSLGSAFFELKMKHNVKEFTKIIATIGPSSESPEMIEKLIEAGVNVFRFNLKHNELEWHKEKIQLVKDIADKMKVAIGTLIDLQGPEIRLITPEMGEVQITKGEELVIKKRTADNHTFCLTDDVVLSYMEEGQKIVVDDGKFQFEVVKASKDAVTLVSHSNGLLKTRKTLNVPGVYFPLAAITQRDKEAIKGFAKSPVDFVALSFVRTAQDVLDLKKFMQKEEFSGRVISKIETKLAIDNLDEIIDSSEGIMVARGDLGVELPIEQVPYYQKIMIKKCLERGFPVITATQMIHSMIERPYPTRAEISDIANAVFDLTDMVMLSEESAAGQYPLEAVTMMKKTLVFNEKHVLVRDTRTDFEFISVDAEEMLCDTAYNLYLQFRQKNFNFGGFVVFTESGRTARKLSRYRAEAPIFCFAPNEKVRDSLTVNYGVIPLLQQDVFKKGQPVKLEDMKNAISHLKIAGLFDKEKYYILLYGDNWNVEGRVSTVKVISPSV